MEADNSRKVIMNTFSLYIRTAMLTIVSLYTSRVVLNVLGVNDYGINNVVGGVVSMFGFITGTLANATQRYFALDMANGDWGKLNKVYSVNLAIYLLFVAVIFVVSETLGLWFVLTKLNYDPARTQAVMVVYEASVISFIAGMLVTPYVALLTADENLSVYSAVSVVEAGLKLLAVYMLTAISSDKLILYAVLTTAAGCLVNLFYFFYVKKKYPRLKFSFCRNKAEYTGIFLYQSWNLIGAVASVLKGQGINIVMNIFYGMAVNAARGVALQVNAAISSFAANFMKAIDPQITKAYGRGEYDRFHLLMFSASKMAFALLFIISFPVIFNTEYILSLWLVDVPDYAAVFVKLALIDAIISSITDSLGTGVQATGKIRLYQIIVGGTLLLNVPVSYILLKMIDNPALPFIVGVVLSVVGALGRIICIRRVHDFEFWRYIKEVVVPVGACSALLVAVTGLFPAKADSLMGLALNVGVSLSMSAVSIYFIVLNKVERNLLINIAMARLKRNHEG